MAKLTGVKTIDMVGGEITKISYKGDVYTKVDVDVPESGDIALNKKESPSYSEGAFYELYEGLSVFGSFRTKSDNDGSAINGKSPNHFVVFRNLDAKPAPKSEALDAKVDALDKRVTALEKGDDKPVIGATVKVVKSNYDRKFGDNDGAGYGKGGQGLVKIGATGEIVDVNSEGILAKFAEDDMISGKYYRDRFYLANGEYEVNAPKPETAPYKTVKRHAKVGERILITDAAPVDGQSQKIGDVLTVTKAGVINKGDVHVEGQPSFIDYLEYEVIVEEAKAPAETITHNGDQYTLVDRKAQAGDVVVITANTNHSRNKVGDIGKVVEASGNDSHSVIVDVPGRTGTSGNYTRFNEMRLATEAERAQYEKAIEDAKKLELKVGDTVEVIDGSKSRYGDLKTGTIGEVTDIYGLFTKELIEVTTDYYFDRFPPSALRKVDKPCVFTKLGRKLNEYKVGDIVEVTKDNALGSRNKAGDIGIVVSVIGSDSFHVQVEARDISGANGNLHGHKSLKLIAPIESRVDTE